MSLESPDLPGNSPECGQAALNEPLDATLTRWHAEALQLERAGIYDWLAKRISGKRVLEIGCGFGASTAALSKFGKTVFALDNRMDCLTATQQRIPEATYGVADVLHYDERLIDDLRGFAPDAVVCWLAGAPAESLPRDVPAAYAVMQHRLVLQQAVVRLAARLETVRTVHLADRTAFPWKMRDTGRQTMARIIGTTVIAGAPFMLTDADVHFRRIPESNQATTIALPGVVPVIGEATLTRKQTRKQTHTQQQAEK